MQSGPDRGGSTNPSRFCFGRRAPIGRPRCNRAGFWPGEQATNPSHQSQRAAGFAFGAALQPSGPDRGPRLQSGPDRGPGANHQSLLRMSLHRAPTPIGARRIGARLARRRHRGPTLQSKPYLKTALRKSCGTLVLWNFFGTLCPQPSSSPWNPKPTGPRCLTP